MAQGIRSTTEQEGIRRPVPLGPWLVSGLVLIWVAGAALGQDPPAAQKPTEPKSSPQAPESAPAPSGEAVKTQEQTERELQWRREVNEILATLRQGLCQMQRQQEKEAAQWQGTEENLRSMAERLQTMERRMRKGRADLDKQQSQLEETRRQQETLQAKVRDVEKQLGTVTERVEAEARSRDQQLDGLRKDLRRMGGTVGQLEQGRLKAEGELKADAQRLHEELGQVRGTLTRLLTQSDRSTVGSAGYTWGW